MWESMCDVLLKNWEKEINLHQTVWLKKDIVYFNVQKNNTQRSIQLM